MSPSRSGNSPSDAANSPSDSKKLTLGCGKLTLGCGKFTPDAARSPWQAAALPGATSSAPECRRVVEVVDHWAVADDEAVLVLAPLLARLVRGSPAWGAASKRTSPRVVAALLQIGALPTLFKVASRQQVRIRDCLTAHPLQGGLQAA
eukprot:1182115-Prorocentrum_minimum.AAC.1